MPTSIIETMVLLHHLQRLVLRLWRADVMRRVLLATIVGLSEKRIVPPKKHRSVAVTDPVKIPGRDTRLSVAMKPNTRRVLLGIDTLRAIQLVSTVLEIKKAYLAGGTALALQLGHRISVDLDFALKYLAIYRENESGKQTCPKGYLAACCEVVYFFTQQEFNETELSTKLTSLPEFIQDGTAQWTVWGKIGQTKFSIFYYKYPLLEKTLAFGGIQLASLSDIAAMKIHAIEDRGTRRDFVDVYFLSKTYALEDMLGFYQKNMRFWKIICIQFCVR